MVAVWAPEEKGTLEEIASLTGTRIIGAEPISYVTLDELGHAERVRAVSYTHLDVYKRQRSD